MDLDSAFDEAASAAKKLKSADTSTMLKLYSLYKQATVGFCNIPKPGFFDFVGKQKWEAWSSLGQMSKNEAMEKYIDLVNSIPREEGAAGAKDNIMGVSVSCMANTDVFMRDEEKTIFDWLKEGNIEQVQKLMKQDKSLLQQADNSGMRLIHWAADRGDSPMVEFLINQGIDINVQDEDGQTPLHYAYSCGHEKCVDILLKSGADPKIKDSGGLVPAELAYEDS